MYDGPMIDSDVHHTWKSAAEVAAYLPREWREYVESAGDGRSVPIAPATISYPGQWGNNKRLDAYPATGGPPGSDYATTRDQLLDPLNITTAILSYDIGIQSGLPNPYFAAAMCRAANDWCLDTWLSRDDARLRGAILVGSELPEQAAAEIRRLGADDRMLEVLLVEPGFRKPFGHPVYHPIYEAAEEMGLPVAIHATTFASAGGIASSRLEFLTVVPQAAMHHLTSLITHGVFERFPSLRVLFVEHGFTWVPSLLWRLDANYKVLRRESNWVKRLPSEYALDHLKFTTQPFDTTRDPQQLIDVLRAFDGMSRLLCFATDYPHWDADEPAYIRRKLPADWMPALMYDNAAELYGLERAATVGAAPER
jgi:uncharacterized protein